MNKFEFIALDVITAQTWQELEKEAKAHAFIFKPNIEWIKDVKYQSLDTNADSGFHCFTEIIFTLMILQSQSVLLIQMMKEKLSLFIWEDKMYKILEMNIRDASVMSRHIGFGNYVEPYLDWTIRCDGIPVED